MDLRHLRYFIAVAEEGSLTNAAERRLHTAQPSLSRQIRDLEAEVGIALLTRTVKGVELTSAGQAFLDHARLALLQVDAAIDAARRTREAPKSTFVIGFMTGQEVIWLAEILRILRQENPKVDITLSSQPSPDLAKGLVRGAIDVAILRRDFETSDIVFKPLLKDPLVVVMNSGHRLTARCEIDIRDIAEESWILPSDVAPALRSAIDAYASRMGVELKPEHIPENISTAMSLLASTESVTLMPFSTHNLFMSPLITYRPLSGNPPMIEVMMGYNKSNTSLLLKRLLARAGELAEAVSAKSFPPVLAN